jgi:ribosomal protein L35
MTAKAKPKKYKLKTNRAAAKRFKSTGGKSGAGEFLHYPGMNSHYFTGKSKRKGKLGRTKLVDKGHKKLIAGWLHLEKKIGKATKRKASND